MKLFLIILLLPLQLTAQTFATSEVQRYRERAGRVEIIIDTYGIPHIYGKTDADAVFGLMYVQSSQNFFQVERNYLEVMGRLSEVEGEHMLMQDLQMQMIYDSSEAKKDYAAAPAWLKDLCNAFADGINYYLHLNPQVKPRVLQKFQPWFPFMYTDGSISATQLGGLKIEDTRALYGKGTPAFSYQPLQDPFLQNLTGSNGFALSPTRTVSGNAMLYINPHVTFYFRTEVHMVSEEGLNVYGAATWGNFFIYQGFNENCGWMHTSSYADVADLYEETIISRGRRLYYRYNGKLHPLKSRQLRIPFVKEGSKKVFPVTVYATHHGPLLGLRNGKWLSLKERNRSHAALMQSWLRTRAENFEAFRSTMQLLSNNSNNTVYADREKNIAYWHGNFIPVRDTNYNWAFPVDGSTPATDWKGVHRLDEIVHVINPSSGWIQNANSTPYTVSGASSPLRKDFPEYMAPDGQNPRALNAMRLFDNNRKFDLDDLIAAGYDTYLTAFDILLPPLFLAYEGLERSDPRTENLFHLVHELRSWDRHSHAASIATTLAIEWGTELLAKAPAPASDRQSTNLVATLQWLALHVPEGEKLAMLEKIKKDLESRFGTWRVAWGDLNRFQRNDKSTNNQFSDQSWSLPVGLASATWGSLPSYNSRRFGTLKRYGFSGNSFVAAVEFGPRLKAKTIMTGGESFNPASVHFTDQAAGFITGRFKEINFYREDVLKNAVMRFQPGEEQYKW